MLTVILWTIHIAVSIFLILVILLQTGKGADMGAVFGGSGSNTVFGSTGAGGFLSKLTTAGAVVFMLTCLILAYMSSYVGSRVLNKLETPAAATGEEEGAPPADQGQPSQKAPEGSAPAEPGAPAATAPAAPAVPAPAGGAQPAPAGAGKSAPEGGEESGDEGG
jgi:preprotein translocase subunit SecG